jgi:hypothetical protein
MNMFVEMQECQLKFKIFFLDINCLLKCQWLNAQIPYRICK